jgi:hypothetical protein
MRASATLVVGVVAVALAGCVSSRRPDAEVAGAVEREEQALRGQVVLASYRAVPDAKVLTEVRREGERAVAPVGAEASSAPGAETRWAAPFGSLSFSATGERYFTAPPRRDGGDDEMRGALQKLQTWPFRKWDLEFDGHTVKPKWTVKGKQLVLNIRIQL